MKIGPLKKRPPRACECGDHCFACSSAWGVILVSPNDAHFLEGYVWTLSPAGRCFYAASERYKEEHGSAYLHRAVHNDPLAERVDHRNNNGLDNRRTNLRPARHRDNIRNARMLRNNTTGFRGVSKSKRDGTFSAKIRVDGQSIHLGTYITAEQAALVYRTAASKYFGEFASHEGAQR